MRTTSRALVLSLRWIIGLACLVLLLASVAATLAGLRPARVDGGSMRPTYRFGDVLIEKHPTGHDLTPGHIVTLRAANGMIYTHRVVKVDAGSAITKGDANRTTDADTATQADVIGVPVAHLTGPEARAYLAVQKPTGKIALVIFIALAVFLPTPRRRERTRTSRDVTAGLDSAHEADALPAVA